MNKQKDLYNLYKSTLLLNVFKNETNLMVLLNMWCLSTFYTLSAVTLFHLLTIVVDNLRELPAKWKFLPTLHLLPAFHTGR